jgi:hypothetical protein|tara:strand:+ start:920 stop:1075 length:156 start_codon:yes stop_codon:yes gene_type:complete
MENLKDSLITAGQGGSAIALSLWTTLPDIVRFGILVATFIHIVIKIKKELK